MARSRTCNEQTVHGACEQESKGRCAYHIRYKVGGFHVDEYYHAKVVKNQVTLTEEYISESEESALFRGRVRHDGRRIDAWAR